MALIWWRLGISLAAPLAIVVCGAMPSPILAHTRAPPAAYDGSIRTLLE